MAGRIAAGQQRRVRRQRDRRGRVGALEQRAVLREPVERRRPRPRVAVRADVIGSQRVDRDQHQVARRRLRRRPARAAARCDRDKEETAENAERAEQAICSAVIAISASSFRAHRPLSERGQQFRGGVVLAFEVARGRRAPAGTSPTREQSVRSAAARCRGSGALRRDRARRRSRARTRARHPRAGSASTSSTPRPLAASAVRASTSSARRYACSAPARSPVARRALPRFAQYDALLESSAAARSNAFTASPGLPSSIASRPRPLSAGALFGCERQRRLIGAHRLVVQRRRADALRRPGRVARGDREIVQQHGVGRPAFRRLAVHRQRRLALVRRPSTPARRSSGSPARPGSRTPAAAASPARPGGRRRARRARLRTRSRWRSASPDSARPLRAPSAPSWRRSRASAVAPAPRVKSRARRMRRRSRESRRRAPPSRRRPRPATRRGRAPRADRAAGRRPRSTRRRESSSSGRRSAPAAGSSRRRADIRFRCSRSGPPTDPVGVRRSRPDRLAADPVPSSRPAA